MLALIFGFVQSIVSGIVGPAFTYLNKKQDVTLSGFQTGTAADQASYQAWVDYQLKIEALKIQANGWWGPRILYMIVGGSAAIHCSAVLLDSLPFWHHTVGSWGVPAPPGDYAGFEHLVIGSLFVTALTSGPVSAATAWLHRK